MGFGEPCIGIVAALNQQGIPFIVTTGVVDKYLPEHVRRHPVLGKPFTAEDLMKALAAFS
jgi:hypothetical protein